METEYITKFEALEAVGAASCDISCYDYEKIEKAIQDILATNVKLVERGEWIETGYFDQYYQPIYECSHCHGEVADNFITKHLFCLHCGADMRKISDSDN
jgi:hypothetical protein